MAVDDLSELADGSLTARPMLAGGVAGPGAEMTAEGSEPSQPLAGREDPAAPGDVTADRGDYRRLVRGEAERGGAQWAGQG